jgi:hypothetical protein
MKTKATIKRAMPFVYILGLALVFSACTGTFTPPGSGGGSGSSGLEGLGGSSGGDGDGSGSGSGSGDGGGSSKPATLGSDASYDDAIAKLNEIITYCNANSGNDTPKSTAENQKTTIETAGRGTWSISKSSFIHGINTLIGQLK